jgi:hypothetical protein
MFFCVFTPGNAVKPETAAVTIKVANAYVNWLHSTGMITITNVRDDEWTGVVGLNAMHANTTMSGMCTHVPS